VGDCQLLRKHRQCFALSAKVPVQPSQSVSMQVQYKLQRDSERQVCPAQRAPIRVSGLLRAYLTGPRDE